VIRAYAQHYRYRAFRLRNAFDSFDSSRAVSPAAISSRWYMRAVIRSDRHRGGRNGSRSWYVGGCRHWTETLSEQYPAPQPRAPLRAVGAGPAPAKSTARRSCCVAVCRRCSACAGPCCSSSTGGSRHGQSGAAGTHLVGYSTQPAGGVLAIRANTATAFARRASSTSSGPRTIADRLSVERVEIGPRPGDLKFDGAIEGRVALMPLLLQNHRRNPGGGGVGAQRIIR